MWSSNEMRPHFRHPSSTDASLRISYVEPCTQSLLRARTCNTYSTRRMDQSQVRRTPVKPACRQCRARRVRCDRVPNCCGPCTRLELDCSYGRGPDTPTQSMVDSPGEANRASTELTQAGTRRRRIRCACEPCRAVKAKCSGGDVCTRCRSRGIQCVQSREAGETGSRAHATPFDGERNSGLPTPNTAHDSTAVSTTSPSPDESERLLIQSYFEKTDPTTCIFLHAPSILADWANGKLDPTLLKTICAFGLRLQDPSDDAQKLASSWMGQAQDALLARLDGLSFHRLQALVLVIHFQLEVGSTVRGWNLLSLAARLAFTLRLNHERPDLAPAVQESRRRTMWVIYAFDRRFCGGLEDLSVCPIERVKNIRLPCEDRTFERGMPSRAQCLDYNGSGPTSNDDMDITAYLLRLYATRDRILRYTKRVRREGVSPALSKDELGSLEIELDTFAKSLPADIQLSTDRVALMAHSRDAPGYFMLHTTWLQGYCDLYRFLIPGVREAVTRAAIDATPSEYVSYCQRHCLSYAVQMCDLWSRISHLRRRCSIDDTLFGACIYQVSQILYHLGHMLGDVPEGVEGLKRKLGEALQMASSNLRVRFTRVEDGLREAERLIQLLGQSTPLPLTRRTSRENIHHMVSRGSLIPRESSDSEDANAPATEQSSASNVSHSLHLQCQNTARPMETFAQPIFEDSALAFGGTGEEFIPWDPFGLQFNEYYDPELGQLGFHY